MPKDGALLFSWEAVALADSWALLAGWGSATVACFSGVKISLAGAGAAADPYATCAEETTAGTATGGAAAAGAAVVATS